MTEDPLVAYWRNKHREAQNEPTSTLVRSLRSQLRTIERLATDSHEDPTDALRSIAVHARIALGIKLPQTVNLPATEAEMETDEADIVLFAAVDRNG